MIDESPLQEPGAIQGARRGSAARVARGTAVRAAGELISKAMTVVFFVVIARQLGEGGFGDFIFGLSLSQVGLVVAGLGTEELITRDVAQRHGRLDELFGDVLALKTLGLILLWLLIAGVLAIAGYPSETLGAILLLGLGVGVEYQAKTFYAVFQAYERQEFIAASMIIQRTITAAAGIAAALAGADLLVISAVYFVCSLTGLVTAAFWQWRFVARPHLGIDRGRWRALVAISFPLGLVTVLYIGLVRLDATVLGFMTGGSGNNSEVGLYGAAHRLIEATMFISIAFGGAMLPWMSREQVDRRVSAARGYEIGLKVLVALLLPIAAVFGLLATDWIELVYGDGYEGAVEPLRWLAVMTVLFGVISFVGFLMIAHDRPRDFVRPAGLVLAQNLVANLILIPPLGATGAAISAVSSGVLLAGWTMAITQRGLGGVSTLRIWGTATVATVALAGVTLAIGGLTVLTLVAGTVAYLVVFFGLERVAYPSDFHLYLRALHVERDGPGLAEE